MFQANLLKWNSCNCTFLKERPQPAESLSRVAPAPGFTPTHSVSGASRTSSQKSHRSDREVFASVWDCAFDAHTNPITSSSYPFSLLCPTLLCWRMKTLCRISLSSWHEHRPPSFTVQNVGDIACSQQFPLSARAQREQTYWLLLIASISSAGQHRNPESSERKPMLMLIILMHVYFVGLMML